MARTDYLSGELSKSQEIVDKMIGLFYQYDENFGLANAYFPGESPQENQCEYEDKFKDLICEAKGHEIGPDQCGKPEHDFCFVCGKLKTEIENA